MFRQLKRLQRLNLVFNSSLTPVSTTCTCHCRYFAQSQTQTAANEQQASPATQKEEEEESDEYENRNDNGMDEVEQDHMDEISDEYDEDHDELLELSPAEQALIDWRKEKNVYYEESPDSEFAFKPMPRMAGPSPFINPSYKRKRDYYSIAPATMPLSSISPLGGHPECWIYNSNNDKLSIHQLSCDLFNQDMRMDVLYKCIRYERLKEIGFTWHIVRNRAEVRGTGKKQRPQKHTGMARMGDMKSPQCRGGGKAHGRRPRDNSIDLDINTYHYGFKIALSSRFKEGDLHIWKEFRLPKLEKPKEMKRNLQKLRKYHRQNQDVTTVNAQELGLNVDFINKHPELPNLVPVFELDWNENTKLYANVAKTKQMLKKWQWLSQFEYERVNNTHTYQLICKAKKSGNVVDMLEAMPIADFGWEFLKEEDEVNQVTIPTVLMIHDGYVDAHFEDAMTRVKGIDMISVDDLFNQNKGVWKLLKYKKIVLNIEALQHITDKLSIESEVNRWNYYAKLIKCEQDENLQDAFPQQSSKHNA